jgi:hypothetical protein
MTKPPDFQITAVGGTDFPSADAAFDAVRGDLVNMLADVVFHVTDRELLVARHNDEVSEKFNPGISRVQSGEKGGNHGNSSRTLANQRTGRQAKGDASQSVSSQTSEASHHRAAAGA